MQDRVAIDIDGHVAHVRLVRSDKMNALDNGMFDAMAAAGKQLADNPDIRAVVLSGEGRAFCAGLDMGNFAAMAGHAHGGDHVGIGKLETRTHGIANGPSCPWLTNG